MQTLIRVCVCGAILGCKIDGVNSTCVDKCHQCYIPKMKHYKKTTGFCDKCIAEIRRKKC